MRLSNPYTQLREAWPRFWMRWSGPGAGGRLACRMAAMVTPPYYGRHRLARVFPQGYFGRAEIAHSGLQLGEHVFVDDRVLIYRDKDGGPVALADHVHIHRDTIIQTGAGGHVSLGERTSVQPRCHFAAYVGPIVVGEAVQVAPNCALFSYNHSLEPGEPMCDQPLHSDGGISIEDDVWLGSGVTVLDGACIRTGAVIAAGAVVRGEIPPYAVAAGVPARVIHLRRAGERSITRSYKQAKHG